MGTLGQSGLPPVSTTDGHGGPLGGRWEIRGKPRKPHRTARMPTWSAAIVGFGAFALLFTNPRGTPESSAFASLFCFAAAANLCASLLAERDQRRGAALRAMYAWDWVALGVSAVVGGAALTLASWPAHEFVLGLLMAHLATLLGLLAGIRHRLAASEPSLAKIEDVFR